MTEDVSPRQASETLSTMMIGERAWFFLCTQVLEPQPVFLISPFERDAGRVVLKENISRLQIPPNAMVHHGIAHLGEDGRLTLGGTSLTRQDLLRLAEWTQQNLFENLGLARLKDVRFAVISDGVVSEYIEEPSAWAWLPRLTIPGSLEDTAAKIRALPVGSDAWFWLSKNGPGQQPFLIISPLDEDPRAKTFVNLVNNTVRRVGEESHNVSGILRKLNEMLVLSMPDDLTGWDQTLRQLSGVVGLEPLADATLIQTDEEKIVATRRVNNNADLVEHVRRIASADTSPLWFFFTQPQEGTPTLLVHADRDALKKSLPAINDATWISGQLKRVGGQIRFRTKNQNPRALLEGIARWVRAHHQKHPSLRRLKNATVIAFRANAGESNEHHDSRLWSFINHREEDQHE